MKIKTYAFVTVLLVTGLFSCKKCITCTDASGQNSQDYCYTHSIDKTNLETQYTLQGGSCMDKP